MSRLRKACSALLALGLGALIAPQAARADTVNLSFVGNGVGRTVHVQLNTQQWDMFAGRLIHKRSNGTASLNGPPQNIATFCTDLLQSHVGASANQYSSASVATLSGNGGATNLGFAKQQAIYDIFHAAAGRQYTAGMDDATAFQLAIWEVVYNFSATAPSHGLSLTGGSFTAKMPNGAALSASIMQKVNALFAAIGANASGAGLMGLKNGQFQDQLFDTVLGPVAPIPASFWPGMAGLGMAALVTWRKKRR
jgi:hypothetical protein